MKKELYSRKSFIRQLIKAGSALAGGGLVVSACRSEEKESSVVESCDDLSQLSQSEKDKREVYGYVEETPYSQYRCENCSLFIPPGEDENCGGCILFEGPVFNEGYCDYWEPEET